MAQNHQTYLYNVDDKHHDKFYNVIAGPFSNVDFEIVESKVNQQDGFSRFKNMT